MVFAIETLMLIRIENNCLRQMFCETTKVPKPFAQYCRYFIKRVFPKPSLLFPVPCAHVQIVSAAVLAWLLTSPRIKGKSGGPSDARASL